MTKILHKNLLGKILLLMIVCVFSSNMFAQSNALIGRDFYFAAWPNLGRTDDKIKLVIFAYDNGTVNIAGTNYSVTKGGQLTKDLTLGDYVSTKSLHITSTVDIVAYAGILGDPINYYTADATAILPVSSLGTEYRLFQYDTQNVYRVIATQSNTKVYQDGTLVSTLAAVGDVYVSSTGSTGLTGKKVTADKPVAVFSGSISTYYLSQANDLLIEQMWPIETWGKEYIMVRLGSVQNNCRIISNESTPLNVTVKIGTDAALTKVVPANGYVEFQFNDITQITADKPFAVAQYTTGVDNPSMMWVNPIDQRVQYAQLAKLTDNSIFTEPSRYWTTWVTILTRDQDFSLTEFKVNGVTKNYTTTMSSTGIPGWKAGRYKMEEAEILVDASNKNGMVAMIEGYSKDKSYIYAAAGGALNLQNYFTIGTKSEPYNDTYYSETAQASHTFESGDNVTIKRNLERSFTSVNWLVNGTSYTVSENTTVNNSWSLPASVLKPGANTVTMKVRYASATQDSLYVGNVWLFNGSSQGSTCGIFFDDVWYFGQSKAGIVFNDDGNGGKVAVSAGGVSNVNSGENSLSVSGPGCGGSLIFYSQHDQLYNSKHEPMKNGSFTGNTSVADGLAACYIGNNKYMLFAVNNCYECSSINGGIIGLDYHIIDMSLDNGYGQKISSGNIEPSGMSESVEVVPVAGTSNEYWLIYRMRNTDELVVRKISNGAVGAVQQRVALNVQTNGITYNLKSNGDFTMLGLAYPSTPGLMLLNFNSTTGIASVKKYTLSGMANTYGVEFSPNKRYVYCATWTTPSQLRQYDIQTDTWSAALALGSQMGGGLKLGPDGKIYVARSNSSQYLGLIPDPNVALTSSTYQSNGFYLGGISNNGLALSTGLTPPAVCPSGTNQSPVAVNDAVSTCIGTNLCINVMRNDSDPDPNDKIRLVEARFSNTSDANRMNLSFNTVDSTVCFSMKTGAAFTVGEKIDIIYTIKDNSSNPLPQCAEGVLTITVTEAYSPALESQSYIACPNAEVNLTIKSPKSGYTFNWYSAATGGTLLGTGTTYTLTKNSSAVQSVWIEPVSALGSTCSRTKVDVILSNYCGGTTPSGCSLTGTVIYKEDFRGNNTSDPRVSPVDLIGGRSDLVFNGVNPASGNYGLEKRTDQSWITSGAFWDNDDHTYPNDINRGYFMYIDPAPSQMNAILYEYDILGICVGSKLSFTTWATDLHRSAARPKIEMQILNKNTGDVIATTGEFLLVRETQPFMWRQYGFDFELPSGVSDITFRIINKEINNIGNDWALDDIEIRFCAPPVTVSGSLSYCTNENMNLQSSYTDDGTFGGSPETRWIYSATGDLTSFSSWSVVGTGNSLTKAVVPGYYRAVVGLKSNLDNKNYNCCAISDVKYVNTVSSATIMYWKTTASNNNWHDPSNWVDVSGNPLNAVPRICTDVHIPGNAQNYPNLSSSFTPTDVYGSPSCNNITFHFGGEVARQEFLTYSKAYIQYNFGYYDASNNYKTDGDALSATPMNRGRWYALSAPLKKVSSGDFSVGGMPNIWQQGFQTAPGHAGEQLNGEWYDPDNNNAREVGPNQNYAISIWAGEYLSGVIGEKDQNNLNQLKGILEMPYFENSAVSNLHRIHSYDGTKSSFQYYWYQQEGLPLANMIQYPPGTLVRGQESYRFIIEDNANKPPVNSFQMTVPAGVDIMIGNPFLASLDFVSFYGVNGSNIEPYYRLFTGSGFTTYPYGTIEPPLIASYQGFFIKTKGSGTVTLNFPLTASVTRASGSAHQMKAPAAEVMDNILKLGVRNSYGSNVATLALNSGLNDKNISQMFIRESKSADDAKNYLQLYVKGRDGLKSSVIFESGNELEIPVGVVGANDEAGELYVENVHSLNATSLMLYDFLTDRHQDMLKNPVYKFKNDPTYTTRDRFMLKVGGLGAPTDIDGLQSSSMNIYTTGHTLYVKSDEEIAEVRISTVHGMYVYGAKVGYSGTFIYEIPSATGIYLVTVILSTGESRTEKVILK